MSVERSLTQIRVNIRKNGTIILNSLIEDYLVYREDRTKLKIFDRCCFCGAIENITREHVLPKWIFDSIQGKTFLSGVNGLSRQYITTTIPACGTCNNELLNEIERHVKSTFTNKKVGTRSYSFDDYENIIRWLEIIHYKWEVTDIMQRFIVSKGSQMVGYLKNFPLAMMRRGGIGSYEVELGLRRSLRRLAVKDKSKHIGSLLFAKTKNKEYHFFHGDEFIFIELPHFNLAVFYFFNRLFETEDSAMKAMQEEIKKHY